jgi:predicted dehydrogenase
MNFWKKEPIVKKVRVGIIGIGNMGTGHAKSIVSGLVPNMELVAIADRKPERIEWAKESLGREINYYSEGRDLIEQSDVEAIVIAVPHYQHTELAILGFNNGKNVLVEKPAGVYTKQVREMNAVAEKSGLAFSMMFNQRTNSVYRKMHEIVQSKEYGDIMRVNWIITDWFRTQHYYDSGDWRGTWDGEGGGVLLNQCPHQLDLLQWICGMPESVQAFCLEGNWHDVEVEDDVTAYLKYPNGATGVFITSTGDAPGTNRFEVTMESAKLICEHDELTLVKIPESAKKILKESTESFVDFHPVTEKVETDGLNPQHVGILTNFAQHILDGTSLIAEGVEGINGLTLSNMMHLSSWTQHAVTTPIDEDLFLLELNKRRATSRYKDKQQAMKGKDSTVADLDGTY